MVYNAAVPWRLDCARSVAAAGRGAAAEASARATSLLRRSAASAAATGSRDALNQNDWATGPAKRAGHAKGVSGRNEARVAEWRVCVNMGVAASENGFLVPLALDHMA